MNALLELDCIPSGMELFPAANEDQWTLIRGVIDDCDYYIVVIGGRYGSIGPEGISYTEMEYRYAVEQEKPVIAFLHKKPEDIPAKHSEQDAGGKEKLEAFRALAQKKMCKYWATPQELGSVVSRSLIMLQKKHPGIGWIRGDQRSSAEATAEMLRLREQVEALRAELSRSESEAPKGTEGLAQGDDDFEIDCKFKTYGPTEEGGVAEYLWTDSVKTTWNDIFYELSPLMINEAATTSLRARFKWLAEQLLEEQMPEQDNFEGHEDIHAIEMEQTDFETVLIQFNALGLIRQSSKARSVKDTGTYWCLTPYGHTIMNQLRAITRDED